MQGGNDQLLEKELATVASHISDWEQLAHALNVADYVRDIQETFRRSKLECCMQMLGVWHYNYESGGWEETAREHLTRQLKKAGYVGAATFLETGYGQDIHSSVHKLHIICLPCEAVYSSVVTVCMQRCGSLIVHA